MNPSVIAHLPGIWLLLFSGSLLPPLVISLIYDDGESLHFSLLVLLSLISGLVFWLTSTRREIQLRTRDGFIIVVLLGGISFGVHFLVWKRFSIRPYWQSVEVRVFLLLVLAVILLTGSVLYFEGAKQGVLSALRYASFTVVSVVTSTGFGIDDFSVWPTLLPLLLILISFVGGCAGSTAGGMKVIRFVIMGKGAGLEIQRLMHPSMVRPIQLQGKAVDVRVTDAVRSFFSVYVATFVMFMLFLMGQGMDQVTAFSAVATSMNNLGPGLGEVATNFQSVSDSAKWMLSFAMLLGRLEIFTLLVVLSPAFWRR